MTQPDKDDLADALARMSAGEETEAHDDHVPLEGLDDSAPARPILFRTDAPKPPQQTPPPVEDARTSAVPSKPKNARAPRVRPTAPPTRPASPNLTPPRQVNEKIVNLSRPAPPPKPAGPPPIYKRLGLRRTIIPILLTLGVILPALGSLPFVVSADSPFAAVQRPVALTFIAIGAILLLTAIVNMIQIKHAMASSRS